MIWSSRPNKRKFTTQHNTVSCFTCPRKPNSNSKMILDSIYFKIALRKTALFEISHKPPKYFPPLATRSLKFGRCCFCKVLIIIWSTTICITRIIFCLWWVNGIELNNGQLFHMHDKRKVFSQSLMTSATIVCTRLFSAQWRLALLQVPLSKYIQSSLILLKYDDFNTNKILLLLCFARKVSWHFTHQEYLFNNVN